QVVGEPTPFVAASHYQVAAALAYYGNFRRFGPTFGPRSQFNIWNDMPTGDERVVVVGLHELAPDVTERILGRLAAPRAKAESYCAGARIRTLWITMPRGDSGR